MYNIDLFEYNNFLNTEQIINYKNKRIFHLLLLFYLKKNPKLTFSNRINNRNHNPNNIQK